MRSRTDGRRDSRRRLVVVMWCVAVLGLLAVAPGVASAADYGTSTSTGNEIIPGTDDLGLHADDETIAIDLPFPVTVYGVQYTGAMVSTNGNVQFTGDSTTLSNRCLPQVDGAEGGGLGTAIVAYQRDIVTYGEGEGIFSTVLGEAPNRQFVLEWRASLYTGQGPNTGEPVNFEVVLNEGSPVFSVIYGTTPDDGANAVTGVQQDPALGSSFTQFSCQSPDTPAGLRVDYTLAPTVTTGPASNVGQTQATIAGTINPQGAPARSQFEYGETTSYGQSTPAQDAGSGTADAGAAAALAGLKPNTTYHYRIVGTNQAGQRSVGEDRTFTTAAVPPAVVTSPASGVRYDRATLHGTVNPNGTATAYHYEYGPTASYGSTTPADDAGAGAGVLSVSGLVTRLRPNTTYHYRLVAVNAGGTAVGADQAFTTPRPARPRVAVAGVRGTGSRCTRADYRVRVSTRAVGLRRVQVTLDGRRIATSTRATFTVRVRASSLRAGRHVLRVTADGAGGRRTTTARFARCSDPALPQFTG